jgi:hypothetical protein
MIRLSLSPADSDADIPAPTALDESPALPAWAFLLFVVSMLDSQHA